MTRRIVATPFVAGRSQVSATPGLTPEQKKAKREAQQIETERQASEFALLCERYGIPAFVREHEFRAGRDSRFDFAWPAIRIALEVEGGIFSQFGHGSMVMLAKDIEKYNAAALEGWLVFRCAPGRKDIVRHRKSAKTGLPTPTPIYALPALCTFTTLKMIRDAIEKRREMRKLAASLSHAED